VLHWKSGHDRLRQAQQGAWILRLFNILAHR
jgi:hypothetical protein